MARPFDPYAPGAVMRLDRAGGGRPIGRNPIGELAVRLSRPKRDGGQGMSMREASVAAIAAARRFAGRPSWRRALDEWPGDPAKAVVDALVEQEAARRWVDENVHGLGGGRPAGLRSEDLLDAGIAKLEAGNERAGDALAALTAQ